MKTRTPGVLAVVVLPDMQSAASPVAAACLGDVQAAAFETQYQGLPDDPSIKLSFR